MSFITAQDISKEFAQVKALDCVSLEIPQSQIFGLLGPNGAGKTTFIRILTQILQADSGTITINNKPLQASDISRIGYLPEERGLYKKMKVGEQALYFASLKGMDKHTAQKELTTWFDRFEIGNWRNKKVEELSKGMQQKVQFIVTVLHKPEILILDEPFSGFDPVNAQIIKEEILRLKNDGATIILSTHNMNSVEELCDSIALINSSKKILHGTMQEIRSSYKSNQYDIVFTGYYDKFLATLTTSYKILDQKQENGLHGTTSIRIELTEEIPTNDIIKYLMNSGNIQSFNQVIPSMNDIFIHAVSQNNQSI
jgi:ABC-2 type transport system ATP-binding protein